MGNNALIRINQLLSESLKDGKISDSEFKVGSGRVPGISENF